MSELYFGRGRLACRSEWHVLTSVSILSTSVSAAGEAFGHGGESACRAASKAVWAEVVS